MIEALENRRLLSVATLQTLSSFNVANGNDPNSNLVADSAGNLYGTTYYGGNTTFYSKGGGTIFEIPKGTSSIKTLYEFYNTSNDAGGEWPQGNLIIDSSGNLYGTTYSGGILNWGTVFEFNTSTHSLTTLFAFNANDGWHPEGGLVRDSSGNLYGAASSGESTRVDGTVFEVTASTHSLITLATFNGTNGKQPVGDLFLNSSGNIYGTTKEGGAANEGTVFEIPAGKSSILTLASFNGTNGKFPDGSMIADSVGNLYGVAYQGGASSEGTIYKLSTSTHSLSAVASFNGSNGALPGGPLIMDQAGDLFGACPSGGADSDGTVFELAVGSSTINALVSFNTSNHGAGALAGVTADSNGNLFGTTSLDGAHSDGTIFEVKGAAYVGGATKLVVATQPVNSTAGHALSTFTIDVENSAGNLIKSNTSTITLAVASGPGTVGGTFKVAAVNGVATFSKVLFTKAGTYTLKAVDGTLTSATTKSFAIVAGAASKLAFSTEPANVSSGTKLGDVQVAVEDLSGNIVSGATGIITLQLSVEPSGASLTGTLTESVIHGIATFTNISVSEGGTYVLKAANGVLPDDLSNAFIVG